MMKSLRFPVNPLLLTLLLILLSAVGVMLFRFYGMKSYEEIITQQKTLESAAFRSCMRELQRLSLIIPVLKQLNTETEGDLRRTMEEAMSLFSQEGEIPHMISGMGYRALNEPDRVHRYDGVWTSSEQTLRDIAEDRALNLKEGDMMLLGRGPETPGILIFLYNPDHREQYYIQAEMDVTAFHSHYVDPAMREVLSGFELEWTVSEPDDHIENGRFPDERLTVRNYRFSPLAALSGRKYNEDRDMRIRVPSLLYLSVPVLLRDEIPGDREIVKDRDIPDNFLFKRDRPFLNEREQILLAGLPDGPFYLETERRNALNWLQSMLLLLGIGAIFLILLIQQSRLKQLREKEKEFVASMTHELRTPLTVIRSASDNLCKGIITSERLPQYGRLIRDQVLRLSTMIEEILMFSSMEGSPEPSEPVETELPSLLDELRGMVDTVASERGVSLHWDREGLPSRGTGDPELIRLILNNLIMNALNHAYAEGSGGCLRIKVHYSVPERLRITVEDEGRGISPGEQKKVFQPFYRDRVSRQNQDKGSGLGLFIVEKKTKAAGGELTLESPYMRTDGKKQQGCRFSATLPYSPSIRTGDERDE